MGIKEEGIEAEARQGVSQGAKAEVEVDAVTESGAIQEVLVGPLQYRRVQR